MKIVNVVKTDKLELECEDEILNEIPLHTTNTIPIADKNDCLIYIILLTTMCLMLLTIVYFSCYYYYQRYWSKKEYSMPY